jgi:DNA polymerase-3 subunit epsilon
LPSSLDRIVVVDVETSGLDPHADRLLSIGAVTVRQRLVRFDESFEVVLEQARPSDSGNILVHGIGGSAQLMGREPVAGLLDFLSFVGKAPLAGFNADFDRVAIERATTRVLGIRPDNVWLDLAALLPALCPLHAAAARTLDDWTGVFGIDNYARHDAVADALATAQLLLVTLACAKQQGIESCAGLVRLEKDQRWLQR